MKCCAPRPEDVGSQDGHSGTVHRVQVVRPLLAQKAAFCEPFMLGLLNSYLLPPLAVTVANSGSATGLTVDPTPRRPLNMETTEVNQLRLKTLGIFIPTLTLRFSQPESEMQVLPHIPVPSCSSLKCPLTLLVSANRFKSC